MTLFPYTTLFRSYLATVSWCFRFVDLVIAICIVLLKKIIFQDKRFAFSFFRLSSFSPIWHRRVGGTSCTYSHFNYMLFVLEFVYMLFFFFSSSPSFFSAFHTGSFSLGSLSGDCLGLVDSVYVPVWFNASIVTFEWWLFWSDWFSSRSDLIQYFLRWSLPA